MNISEKYNTEEWRIISYLPQAVGLLIGGAGSRNILASGSEMITSTKTFINAEKQFAQNKLILEVIGNTKDQLQLMKNLKQQLDTLTSIIDSNSIKTTEELATYILNDCEKALEFLNKKENQGTIQEYKSWLLDIAFKVANTSKEGSFLGFGGERFSKEEKRLYKKLEAILK